MCYKHCVATSNRTPSAGGDSPSGAEPAVTSDPKAVPFDRAAEYYDQTRGYPDGVGERVADLLCSAGALGTESTVLEIGVGTGRIALPLASRVQRVAGVDLSRPMLARLRAKPGAERVRAVLGNARELPFTSRHFDAVVSVAVFHLLPEWRRVLGEVRRVLAPGGRLLTAVDSWLLRELWEAGYVGIRKPDNVGVAQGAVDFPCEAGFRVAEPVRTLRYPQRVSFPQFMREIEQRVWSVLWRFDEQDHARLCRNMRAAIIDRYGSLDAEVEVEREVSVRVFAPA